MSRNYIILNSKASNIVLQHLEFAKNFTEQLIKNNELVEHEKQKPILNYIGDNTKLVKLLIDKYVNLSHPETVRDIFSGCLHIELRLTRLTNDPTLERAELLLKDISSLISILKEK